MKYAISKTQTFFIFCLLFAFCFLHFASPISAQIDIGENYSPPLKEIEDVGTLVSTILSNAYVLAGLILLVTFILAGLSLISNSGSQDPQKKAQWRSILTSGVVGFLIIVSSYWIIQLVELFTGFKILGQ